MNKHLKIAVLGARGMIGKTLLNILEESGYEIELDCFGITENALVSFGSKTIISKTLNDFDPFKYEIIFSAIKSDAIKELKEKIKESNTIWIDKSSAFRMDEDVSLIVPEVNLNHLSSNIVASPNCVVIPISIFLKSIEKFDVESVNITTYQSISGAGKKAMDAFFREVKSSNLKSLKQGFLYDDPMVFNVIPFIGELQENEYCDEEIKIEQELKKILPNLSKKLLSVTTMRVPVLIGHLISLNFSLKKQAKQDQIIRAMEKLGIVYCQKPCTPLMAVAEDLVFASRLKDHGNNNWSIILVCDNLRKGGALNAWQIAQEMLLKKNSMQ